MLLVYGHMHMYAGMCACMRTTRTTRVHVRMCVCMHAHFLPYVCAHVVCSTIYVHELQLVSTTPFLSFVISMRPVFERHSCPSWSSIGVVEASRWVVCTWEKLACLKMERLALCLICLRTDARPIKGHLGLLSIVN